MEKRMKRRSLLKTSVAASVAFSAAPLLGAGATRKYRTALIGTGWWGMNILRYAMESGECQIVAMADVDQNQIDPAAAEVSRLTGDRPKKYRDYRELLATEKPEIVIVATPDHWHPLI